MNPRLQHYGEALGILLAVYALWWHFTPPTAPVGATVLAKPADELKGAPTQIITLPKVKVYTAKAKKPLGLPADIQGDTKKYVLGSAKLPSDHHPHTITTVIDANTGDVQTYDRRDPLPWLATEQTGEIWIDYGVKNAGVKVGRISLRKDLLQVNALHAGINAALDTDGLFFVGAGVGWKW
jgi:hypothetical protein